MENTTTEQNKNHLLSFLLVSVVSFAVGVAITLVMIVVTNMKLRKEINELTQEHDALLEKHSIATQERDAIRQERDGLRQEHDGLASRLEKKNKRVRELEKLNKALHLSNTPIDNDDKDVIGTQDTQEPLLPSSKRSGTRFDEVEVAGRWFKVRIGSLKFHSNAPVTAYVTGTFADHVAESTSNARGATGDHHISFTYDGKPPVGGFFDVKGQPVKPKVYLDNKSVAEIGYDSVLRFLEPGNVKINVDFQDAHLELSVDVLVVPIPPRCTPTKAVELLGFPDFKKEGLVSWPDSTRIDGVSHSPRIDEFGGKTIVYKHWRYDEYPGAVLVWGDRFELITRH